MPKVAKEVAKLMIDHEEMVGLGDTLADDRGHDTLADTRREQLEARWAAQDAELAAAGHRTRRGKQLPRKKRKASDYSKQFGIILKALKKKHPQTTYTSLMKKDHTQTKKKMKTSSNPTTGLP